MGLVLKIYIERKRKLDTLNGSQDCQQTGQICLYNKYEENKAHVVVKAQKTVNEQNPANDECFDFTLAKYDNDSGQWKTVETVQNSGRNVTFSQLNYDTVGIYYYKITETGQKSGYTYDTAVYVVKVEVEQTNNKLNTEIYKLL